MKNTKTTQKIQSTLQRKIIRTSEVNNKMIRKYIQTGN